MNRLAFDNVEGSLFQLTGQLLEKGILGSLNSPRKRMILPLHRKQDAEVQRMINFLQPGTYIRPHRHPLPHATESLVMIRGSILFITFDDSGSQLEVNPLSALPFPGVLDIEPGVWHTFLVREPDTILFECKKGPYDAAADKEFAEWSPQEGSREAELWLEERNRSVKSV
ncbi:MAG: cupin fold metalloprotein, WbuC family [Balneolaceae bacterium]|nr:MAG: cupin fold metalloprotein, WbuC family [Balneolaceae bacterium]